LPDGSTALSFDHRVIDGKDPAELAQAIAAHSNGFVLPGWEPERLQELQRLFKLYEGMDEEKLFANLEYFLTSGGTGRLRSWASGWLFIRTIRL
jgi:mannonate dehydratase